MLSMGKVALGPIHDWAPDRGSVVSWNPSTASLARVKEAPISDVPASHMQAEHLRTYRHYADQDLDMARLCIATWDIPGICDVRAMSYVINAHLRRHDTYRSWFEYTDDDQIVRRTIPKARDIEFVPTVHGEMSAVELRSKVLATPSPLEWDCLRFMIIQHEEHFSFCVCVDHIYIDAMFIGLMFTELHMMYAALAKGGAPIRLPDPGSYLEHCVRQHERLSGLTLDSPPARAWLEFLESNGGTLPVCRLPLGDSAPTEVLSTTLLDARQTAAFESTCMSEGVRFSGGVFACASFAERELTGAETFYGMTATDTRSTPTDFLTNGWYTGFAPITVPIYRDFGETARAAQGSFDSGKELANVPFGRMLELAPRLTRPQGRVPLLFFLDAGIPPLSALVNSQLDGSNAQIYHDGGIPAQFDIRVNRFETHTQLAVLFPDNPVARESVTRYMATLKSIYLRVAEGREVDSLLRDNAAVA